MKVTAAASGARPDAHSRQASKHQPFRCQADHCAWLRTPQTVVLFCAGPAARHHAGRAQAVQPAPGAVAGPSATPSAGPPQCRPLSLQLVTAAQTWSGQCRPSRLMWTPGGWLAPLQCGGQSQAPHLQTAARRRCAGLPVTAVHSGVKYRAARSATGSEAQACQQSFSFFNSVQSNVGRRLCSQAGASGKPSRAGGLTAGLVSCRASSILKTTEFIGSHPGGGIAG